MTNTSTVETTEEELFKTPELDEAVSDEAVSEDENTETAKEKISRTLKEGSLEAIRKNPQKYIAQAKKFLRQKKYFKDDNQEEAIINMLNSGLGRRGLRELARKMMISWKEFIEMIDTIYEYMPERLSKTAKKSIFERYRHIAFQNKMSFKQLSLRRLILHFHKEKFTIDDAIAYDALLTMDDKIKFINNKMNVAEDEK